MSRQYISKEDEGSSLGRLRGQGKEVVNADMRGREKLSIQKQQVRSGQSEGNKGLQEDGGLKWGRAELRERNR